MGALEKIEVCLVDAIVRPRVGGLLHHLSQTHCETVKICNDPCTSQKGLAQRRSLRLQQ
jgi:hypothetical protein